MGCTVCVGVDVGAGGVEVDVIYISFIMCCPSGLVGKLHIC